MSSATDKSFALLLLSVTLLSAAPTPPTSNGDQHISVYSPVALYSLPLLERAGSDYVGLLELLEPLGQVSSVANGRSLKIRYNATDAEFTAGKTQARIHGHNFDLSAPFLIENSRGLVPLGSLGPLLSRFLGAPVNFREAAHRLFIGDVGIQPGFRLDASNPPRLLLNFTAPVTPTISQEPGGLRIVFKRDPVVSPGSQSISFDNQVITHAAYSEVNGDAELEVTATQPLTASVSADKKTITISPPVAAQLNPIPARPQNLPPSTNTNSTANASAHRILAVVDPAHGGDERGAALTETLAEKNVTLGFARLLRHELELRGFAVQLLRDADTSLSLDQRASAANTAHSSIYITLHAVSQGSGVRVYTALLPVEGETRGIFHAWNAAQAPALPISRTVAAAMVAALQKSQFSAQASSASLRPLNNVFMPAIAVELAPGPNGIADLTSANYQQRAASAIADATFALRDHLGAQP